MKNNTRIEKRDTMIAEIMQGMVDYSKGNTHDIAHLMKVWGWARTIGMREGLDADTQMTLEIAAIVHDIAIPSLRVKYGRCDGKLQEAEGPDLAREFLSRYDIGRERIERVAYLVGHHHTVTGVDGIDWQILLEADYLVNSDEGKCTLENIRNTCESMYKTKTGTALLKSIYPIGD